MPRSGSTRLAEGDMSNVHAFRARPSDGGRGVLRLFCAVALACAAALPAAAAEAPPIALDLGLQFQSDRSAPLFPPVAVPPGHPLYVTNPAPVPEAPQPAWLRYAVAADPGARPMIAVVIDDFGVNRAASRRMLALPGPLTISIMTYAGEPAALAQAVRLAGHEVMLHMPMEPMARSENPGPKALLTGLDQAELLDRIRWGLDRFDGFVGLNNHMGSRFTAAEPGMRLLLQEVRDRGLLFLDSMTTGRSVGRRLALEFGIPFIKRDIFLDHHPGLGSAAAQLRKAEALALKRGYAVVIGHPRPDTIAALAAWLPLAVERGFAIVPLTAIVQRHPDTPTSQQTATIP